MGCAPPATTGWASSPRGRGSAIGPDAHPGFAAAGVARPARPRVLVVDDELLLCRALARALENADYEVTTVQSGEDAIGALGAAPFDVVLSDVNMPRMNGIELLRRVRERDLDIPVIFMTGAPALEVAVDAIEYGAMRYLFKPVHNSELVEVLGQAVKMGQLAQAKRSALELLGRPSGLAGDRAGFEAVFRRALASLWMAYQPIVSWSRRTVVGYEALLRTPDASLGDPGTLLHAAEQLGRLPELGRAIRQRVASDSSGRQGGVDLFVNLHPRDLLDETLYLPDAGLSPIATGVVLEITERASLSELGDIKERLARLRAMGYRIAVDDLGAGYAGLASFAQLEPEVVKIDMALVREVHLNPTKQKLVASMVAVCRDLGIEVLAEGVETPEERDALLRVGCDLFQGYLFGRPRPPFAGASF